MQIVVLLFFKKIRKEQTQAKLLACIRNFCLSKQLLITGLCTYRPYAIQPRDNLEFLRN